MIYRIQEQVNPDTIEIEEQIPELRQSERLICSRKNPWLHMNLSTLKYNR